MKVLYIIDQNIEHGNTSGIIFKVKGQISQWVKHDCEVDLLSLYEFKLYNSDLEMSCEKNSFKIERHGRYFTLLRMMISTFKLILFLKESKYDLIYMRQRPWMPFTKMAFENQKVVMEINTVDIFEYKTLSRVMSFYNKYTRNLFYGLAHGFVGVTEELTNYYNKEFNVDSITIGNGISVYDYPVTEPKNSKPQICFVGSPGFIWHGLDKVIDLADRFQEYDFHIVGIDGVSVKNIKYYGYLSLEETCDVVAKSDVGLCTLSFHLNGLTEACPLKSRQYLAQGLPIVYAYDDVDLSGEEKFALKISNNPTNIKEYELEIKQFVNYCFNNIDLRKEVREYSERVIDTQVKEGNRVLFFQQVIKAGLSGKN
jgi:hypothetical protein